MEDSSLRNVFGSSASLAELSGDTSGPTPRSGYTRFGLNEHPPSHQMHTKVRKPSIAPNAEKPNLKRSRRWYFCVPTLLLFGLVQALLMGTHLPLEAHPDEKQRSELLVAGSLLALLAGYLVPATDRAATSADLESSTSRNWKTNLIRSYGALLGLLYLREQLPKDAILAWVFIAPSWWYIGDGTLNGFFVAVCISLMGTASTLSVFPSVLTLGWQDSLREMTASGVAYYGTSLVAGNVGRGLRK